MIFVKLIWANRQWLFSGVGAVVLVGFIHFLRSRFNKNRRFIEVVLTHGCLTYDHHLGPPSFIVEARNPGTESVTLNAFGLRLPNGRTLISPTAGGTVQLPYDLPSGKNCIMWLEVRHVADSLKRQGTSEKVKLVGFYRDALGKEYKSKALEFDPSSWLRKI